MQWPHSSSKQTYSSNVCFPYLNDTHEMCQRERLVKVNFRSCMTSWRRSQTLIVPNVIICQFFVFVFGGCSGDRQFLNKTQILAIIFVLQLKTMIIITVVLVWCGWNSCRTGGSNCCFVCKWWFCVGRSNTRWFRWFNRIVAVHQRILVGCKRP